ncbi:hypothetical protein QD47_26140 [Paenibacillus terrae]|uniref:Uncharacterized protein n=1 Tax=Paenibacillus terrae TaxID=159743 RepID=A0A0D7WUF4_9BACL|nr:hypothetical protein QD47_26140 [Paenibacillus terrae]
MRASLFVFVYPAIYLVSSKGKTISSTNYSAIDDKIEIHIDYEAILAVDLPNGLKKGKYH